jgi:hypothetical protein
MGRPSTIVAGVVEAESPAAVAALLPPFRHVPLALIGRPAKMSVQYALAAA